MRRVLRSLRRRHQSTHPVHAYRHLKGEYLTLSLDPFSTCTCACTCSRVGMDAGQIFGVPAPTRGMLQTGKIFDFQHSIHHRDNIRLVTCLFANELVLARYWVSIDPLPWADTSASSCQSVACQQNSSFRPRIKARKEARLHSYSHRRTGYNYPMFQDRHITPPCCLVRASLSGLYQSSKNKTATSPPLTF